MLLRFPQFCRYLAYVRWFVRLARFRVSTTSRSSGCCRILRLEQAFQAAGLDMARFQPVEPRWTPAANWDQRAAWTAGSMRVEAAAWRALPISFRIVEPWTLHSAAATLQARAKWRRLLQCTRSSWLPAWSPG
jgi:hypothetical protein